MFFDEERIISVREMIYQTQEDRAKALEKLLPHQKKTLWKYSKLCMVYLSPLDYLIRIT